MTIKDIAKECGCAVGTVSRVLNNQDYVSKKTREKVLEVVNKYGFELNKNAKALKSHGSKTIVVIVNGTSSPLLNSLLEIVQRKLEKSPYIATVVVIDEYDNEVQKAYNIYLERKPLGIVFLGGNPERYEVDFEKIRVPSVLISTKAEKKNASNLSSVSTDDYAASKDVALYLAKCGHKKIALISGELEMAEVSKRRYKGFKEGLDEEGIPFDLEKCCAFAKYSFASGACAMEELLKKYPTLTAVYAMSDVMAIGACRKLNDLGYKVPEDVSIVGFDGLDIADYYCPKITTIRQKKEKLVEEGIEILIDNIENNSGAAHRLIPYEFVEGESVRKL